MGPVLKSRRSACASVWLASLILTACGDDARDASSQGSSSGTEELPSPSFIDPASGQLAAASTRTSDVLLQVIDIVPGRTELVVDAAVISDLNTSSTFGTLTPTELRIRMRGAMVPDTHRMLLQTSTVGSTLESAEIAVIVRPNEAPALQAAAGSPTLPARVVTGWGRPLIGALDDSDPAAPLLTVVRANEDGDGWAWSQARTITLAGYVAGPDELGLAMAAAVVDDDGSPPRLRVAWRVGFPGRAIQLLDTRWEDATVDSLGAEAFALTPALTGPVDYASFGRPLLLGDVVLAELHAASDVEAPRPGDRAVVQARLVGAPAVATTPQRVSFGPRQDIDMLGPVVDALQAESGKTMSFSARLAQRHPAVIEVDAQTGLLSIRPTRTDTAADTFTSSTTPLLTVAGALGSRLVTTVAQPSGQAHLLRGSDLSSDPADPRSLDASDLPDPTFLTGEPAVAVVGGAAVVLFPYGPQTAVHAVQWSDEEPTITALDPLRCTSVAITPWPTDAAQEIVPVACTLDGQVLDAHLQLSPAP